MINFYLGVTETLINHQTEFLLKIQTQLNTSEDKAPNLHRSQVEENK